MCFLHERGLECLFLVKTVLCLADLCALRSALVFGVSAFLQVNRETGLTNFQLRCLNITVSFSSGDQEIPVVYLFSKYGAFVIIDQKINMHEHQSADTVEGNLNLEHLKKDFCIREQLI